MSNGRRLGPGEPRSVGAIPQRRIPQAWPKDRRFRILSIDGGGIRGIFPAAVLAGLERRFTVLLSPVLGAVTPLELATWLLESHLPVRMQLQMHKYIWAPQARVV